EAGRDDIAKLVKTGVITGKEGAAQLFAEANAVRAQQRAMELAEFEAGLKAPKVTAAEQKIQRLMETGLDRTTAIAIADGRIGTSKDPVTGEVTLIDKATGSVIGRNLPQQVAEEAPADASEEAGLFEGLDVSKGLGLGGWARSAVNVVTDAVGAGQKFPEAGKVEAALKNLQTRTTLMAGIDVEGRPSNFTREEIKLNFTITPSEISTGPERAYLKANAMVQMLEQTYAAMNIAAQGGGGASVQQQKNAVENIDSLKTLLRDYRSLRDALEQKGGATGQTTSGATSGTVEVSPEQLGLIQKYKKVPYYVENMTPGPD
ncbi:MAG: hypothetical protein VW715_15180, partial [Rhodospirillales bacterium]